MPALLSETLFSADNALAGSSFWAFSFSEEFISVLMASWVANLASCCFLSAAALAIAIASNSALLFLPRCFGKSITGSSVEFVDWSLTSVFLFSCGSVFEFAGSETGCVPSWVLSDSLNNLGSSCAEGPVAWFFITSKFSPSFPLTV